MADFGDFVTEASARALAPNGGRIPPEIQASRDAERTRYLQDEFSRFGGEDQAAVGRELTREGVTPKKMDFGDFAPPRVRPTEDPTAPASLASSNFRDLLGDLWAGPMNDKGQRSGAAPTSLGDFGSKVVQEAASLGDLVLGIPAQLVGTGAALGMGARAIGSGKSREEVAAAAKDANTSVMQAQGTPLRSLLGMAGLGAKGEGQTATDSVMGNLTKLLEKGGAWVEEATGGKVLGTEVENIVNAAMAAGGGAGLAAGLKKMVPKDLLAEGVKLSPEALRRVAAGELQKMDAPEAVKTSQGQLDEAVKAAQAGRIPEMEPSSLDTALEKVAAGKQFDMTAEERIAYKGWQANPPPPPPVQAALSVPRGQRGAIDVGAFLPREDGKGLSLEELQGLSPTLSLGSLLGRSDYTLKTLERLGQGKVEFGKQEVMDQLKRDDVSAPEKAAVQAALDAVPGKRVTAKDLVVGVKKATGDFELQAKETDKYADYGLGEIRDYDPENATPGETPPRTTLYRVPEGIELSSSNHFNDPRLFGWTRSFDEGGVRHVVEIQSDLAQHAKGLSPDARADIEGLLRRAQGEEATARNALEKAKADYLAVPSLGEGVPTPTPAVLAARETMNRAQNLHRSASLHVVELQAKLADSASLDRVTPLLKNWPKRLVREELAQEATRRAALPEQLRTKQEYIANRLRNYPEGSDVKAYHQREAAGLERGVAAPPVVRFATADTVAKVEEWPDLHADIPERLRVLQERIDRFVDGRTGVERDYLEATKRDFAKTEAELQGPRFRKEHQTIYDRYRGDIEKFLRKDLGGKDVTDSAGHTWIEVPLPSRGPTRMFGGADTKTLLGIAAVGLGAWAGTQLDPENPISAAALGGLAGALGIGGAVGAAKKALGKVFARDTRVRINDLTERRQLDEARFARATASIQAAVVKAVPKAKDREAIHLALDAGTEGSLPLPLRRVAEQVRAYYDTMGQAGLKAGVIEMALQNYSTHLWDLRGPALGIFRGLANQMSASSPFAKTRAHVTVAAGEAAGLVAKTKDIAEVLGIYGNSMGRAIANKLFLNDLGKAKLPTGERLILPRKALYSGTDYQSIDHPQLAGKLVHPDIVPSLKFMFEAQDPGAAMAAISAVNTALKRAAVSFSLFHAKSLFDAGLGAMTHPGKALAVVGQSLLPRFLGEQRMLKMMKEGGVGDLVDKSLRDGLKFSMEKGIPGVEDVNGSFYQGAKWLQNYLDSVIPKLGTVTVGPVAKLNHVFDTITWTRLHAAFKLEVYASKLEALKENTVRDPHPLTDEQAGRMAASYTNDVFGGLNWQRLAEGATTRLGRDMSLSLLSPRGRRMLQLGVFALDWTLSTMRAFTQSFGKGSGPMGLLHARTLADLHRQQLVRGMLYYFVVGDSLNYALSGHHLWENKDWTRVDLGDGRTMQLSKHLMEPFHWFMHPGQQALNKMGQLPKQVGEQLLNQSYLSPNGAPPIVRKGENPVRARLGHLAGMVNPIGIQQFRNNGAAGGLSGMLGVPIYGKTLEQRRVEKAQKRRTK